MVDLTDAEATVEVGFVRAPHGERSTRSGCEWHRGGEAAPTGRDGLGPEPPSDALAKKKASRNLGSHGRVQRISPDRLLPAPCFGAPFGAPFGLVVDPVPRRMRTVRASSWAVPADRLGWGADDEGVLF